MWNCGECQMEFESKTKKDYHQKVTHRKIFMINGLEVKEVDGLLHCLVTDCSKTYKTVEGIYVINEGLRKHLKFNHDGVENLEEELLVEERLLVQRENHGEDCEQTLAMKKLGLIFNKMYFIQLNSYGVIICIECNQILTKIEVHIRQIHQKTSAHINGGK